MAITPEKVNFNNISEVTNGSGVKPEHINYPLKASAYAQALATNQPNITNANKVGIPSVTIEEINGTPRLKFENLKGEKGLDGTTADSLKIATLNSQVQSNTNSISFLTSLAESNNDIVKATVEDTFSVRQTADGLNVIDNSIAIVDKIKGNSILCSNLFNGTKLTADIYSDGTTVTIDKNTITVKSTGSVDTLIFNISKIYVEENTTYTLSFKKNAPQSSSSISVVAYFYDSSNNQLGINGGTDNITFTTPANCSYLYIEFTIYLNSAVASTNVVSEIMLNYGDTALPYMPTFEGVKNCNFKAIKSTGKNLFNINEYVAKPNTGCTYSINNGTISISSSTTRDVYVGAVGVSTSSSYFGNQSLIAVQGGKTFTLSFKSSVPNKSSVKTYVNYYDKEGKHIAFYNLENLGYKFTTPTNCAYISLRFGYLFAEGDYVSGTLTTGTFSNIMLNYGDTALPYEDYAIVDELSVESAVELGEFDYISPQTGEIVKQTSEVVFTGAEKFAEELTNEAFNGCALTIAVQHYEDNRNRWGNGLSNYLAEPDWNIYSSWINATEDCFKVQNGKIYLIFVGKTIAQAKAYLTELYNNGTPLTILYQNNSPTITTAIMNKNYLVSKNGAEIVEQGDIDNSKYGANCETTIKYYVEGVN